MKDLKQFDISFIGLKDGIHQFEYVIDKTFFDFYKYDEINNSNVVVNVSFLKKTTLFELDFECNGWLELGCDVTNELFKQPIKTNLKLVVKFGDVFNDENEEILIIPHAEHKLNVAQYIYEAIVLAIPAKRVHPGLKDGSLKSDIIEKLKEFEINNNDIDKGSEVDPRWNKLKDILNR